jgi:replication-associated recombination protein RarA
MGHYDSKTEKGYSLSDVVSALQKEIRRGNEREAVYWMMEMVPAYENYFWKRLMIILHEDIGVAAPTVMIAVQQFRELYWDLRKDGKEDDCYMMAVNALILMCRAPKTRICLELLVCVTMDRKKRPPRDIPDYALDMHTDRGRRKSRGIKHFVEEASLLSNRDPDFTTYQAESEAYELKGEFRDFPWVKPNAMNKKMQDTDEGTDLPDSQPSLF